MAEWTTLSSNSLAVIDKQIADWQSIFATLPTDSDVVFIEQGEDGLAVLTEALAARNNLDSIHIFSHGQSGKVQLGSAWLDSQGLAENPLLTQAFSSAVSADGDILLYGCDVAQLDSGKAFVTELAHLTGADVAASVNLTGSAGLLADWNLEYQAGHVTSTYYSVSEFSGTLALPGDGLYTFAGATKSGDVFVTSDGFFEITGYDGNGQNTTVNADKYGAYIQESTTTGGPYTSYIEVRVKDGGSFKVSTATILDFADGSGSHDFYNIYAVGLANGTTVATTASVSSVGVLHSTNYPIDYTPFNGVYIDTFRVYYTWSTGTAQEDFNLESITINGASTEPPASTTTVPSLSATSVNPTFTENGGAADLFSTVTAATKDSGQTFSSLKLTVTNVSNGSAESLSIGGTTVALVAGSGSITGGGSYTVTVNSGTATITITGMTRSDAEMGTLIDGISYSNSSDTPSTSSNRVVTITEIGDSGSTNNSATPNKSSTVTVVATNDAPVVTSSSGSISFTENASAQVVDSGLSLSDADSSTLASATVSITGNFQSVEDVLAFTNNNATNFGNIAASYNSSTGVLTLTSAESTATVAQFQNALRAVTYQNTSDAPATATRTLSFVANDGSANASAATREVTVSSVNDLPAADADKGYVNTGASTETAAVVTISNTMLQDGDPDNSGSDITYTVTTATSNGTLFVDADSDGIVDAGEARGASATFTQKNIDDGQLKYSHGGGANSADSFTFSVADPEGTGVENLTFSIAVTARPVVTPSGTVSYAEDGDAAAISPALTITDADSANLASATITITDFLTGDVLSFTDQNGITGSYNSGTGVLTLSGTSSVANYQAALRSINYSSTNNNPATGTGNTDRVIEFRVSDGSLQSVAGTNQTVSVSNTNDAPVLDADESPALTTVSEDAAAPVNNSVVGATLVSTLVNGVSDVDTGAVRGVAITGATSDKGTLWFSTDAGESWTQATATSDTEALLLRGENYVYWQPAANVNGTTPDALTFRGWDLTTGAEGSYVNASSHGVSTAFSSATDTISVSVTAVNDAPTLSTASKALAAIDENTTSTATKVSDLLTDLGYADVEGAEGGIAITAAEGAGSWQYSNDGTNWFDVAMVSSSASLLLSADAFTRYVPDNKNGETGAQLVVRAWDSTTGTTSNGSSRQTADTNSNGGAQAYSSAVGTLTVNVSAVNDAPTITKGATYNMTAINEDSISATLIVSDLLADAGYADVDTGAVSGIVITSAAGNGTWSYSVDGNSWLELGTVAADSAMALGSSYQLRYTGDEKQGETATISYRAWDTSTGTVGNKVDASTTGASTAFSAESGSVSLIVQEVNDRPVVDTKVSPSLTAINEDAAAPQNAVTIGTAQGATLVSSLLGGASDIDNSTLGVAVTAASAEGALWYSLDTGKTWTAASNLSNTTALLLAGDDLVYFEPADNKSGTISDALTFHVWDTSAEGAGDTFDITSETGASSPFSENSDSVSVVVTAVNDAPTITASDTFVLSGTNEDTTTTGTLVSAMLTGVEWADVDANPLSGIAVTAASGLGGWQFSPDGSTWTDFPVVSSSAALLLSSTTQVRYVPDAERAESVSLTFRAWDQSSGAASGNGTAQTADTSTHGGTSAFSAQTASATLAVSDVNDAPVLDTNVSPVLASITEDLGAPSGSTNSVLVSSLVGGVSDVDSSSSKGIAVVATNTTEGTLWYYTFGSWRAVSGAADNNALLLSSSDRVYWAPAANKNGTVSDALTFRAWDLSNKVKSGNYRDTTTNGDTTAFSTATDTVSVTVTAVNDAPTLSVFTKALTGVNEDTTTTTTKVSDLLSDLGYADVDNNTGGIAVSGAEGAGDWQYSTDGSNWFDVATVSSSASLLLDTDSLLRYVPDGNNGESDAQLDVRAWDGTSSNATDGATRGTLSTSANGGALSTSSDLATVTVAVSDVNDAPTINNNAAYTMTSINEDSTSTSLTVSSLLADAGYADVDTGAVSGIAVTASSGNGSWEYLTGKTWTAISSLSESSALLLSSTTELRYVGDNKQGETATLSYRAWDTTTGTASSDNSPQKGDASTHGSTSAFSGNSGSVSLVVTAVNDAPVLDTSATLTLTGILEDVAAPVNNTTLGSAQGATLVSTLTGGITDIDHATPGIAITTKAATGTLWFSTNGGALWTQANAVSDSNALLLRASDLVYYQPAANANGELEALSFRAWDTSTGAEGSYVDASSNGGSTAFSAATESVAVSTGAVNDAPSVSVTNAEGDFTENDAALTLFSSASVSVGPANENTQTLSELTLTVSGLHDDEHELFTIDGSEMALTDGNTVTTATNGLSVSVSVTAGTATVTASGTLTSAQAQTLINSLAYRNSSENPDETNRVITLTSIKDNGGTTNSGVDTGTLNTSSVVTVTAVNDDPTGEVSITGTAQTGQTLSITETLEDLDGLGTFTYIWKADDVVIDDETDDTLQIGAELLNKVITATVEYTDDGGTKETVTSKATSAVAEPPVTTTNVDGAQVSDSVPGTAPDGTTVQVVEIGIVGESREEQTGESELANIPLVTDGDNNALLEVGLPQGTGMRVETPGGTGSSQLSGRDGLIAAIRSRTNTPDKQQDQQEMTGVGGTFLDDLPNQGDDLIVRTLVPVMSADNTTAPTQAIKISAPPTAVGDRPVATVIDVRGLPSGTVIQLENIQFVAIVGNVTMIGGEGAQVMTGDNSRQIVVLGEDDDVLRGGGGDDFVGSRGGEDRLYGDAGNDHVVGGAGNDHLEGGDGNDILQGGASDAGSWQFSLVDGELVSRFTAEQALAADAATLAITGPWWTRPDGSGQETDHRLQFTYESADRLQLVATLYKAAVGERASLMEFNEFTTSGMSDLQLSQAAVDHWFNSQGVMPQAIEVQVAMLVNAVWGEGAATDELITIGSDFITSGGSWAEGMMILARAVEAQQLLANDNGDLVLVKDLVTSETGRNQGNAGDDTLLGGAGNDRLIGGGGNNFLDGGEGTDVAVYTGAAQDFTFQIRIVDGMTQMVLTTEHSGAVDVLQNIEVLKIGAYYYAPASSINEVAQNTDHALESHLVQLTGQQVQAMDLAGIY